MQDGDLISSEKKSKAESGIGQVLINKKMVKTTTNLSHFLSCEKHLRNKRIVIIQSSKYLLFNIYTVLYSSILLLKWYHLFGE